MRGCSSVPRTLTPALTSGNCLIARTSIPGSPIGPPVKIRRPRSMSSLLQSHRYGQAQWLEPGSVPERALQPHRRAPHQQDRRVTAMAADRAQAGRATGGVRQLPADALKGIATILLSVALTACVAKPPPIGKDLPSNFAAARPVFDQRIKQRFPVGSSERELLGELARESFKINPSAHAADSPRSASYESSSMVCKLLWVVDWSAEDGRITDIQGDYGSVCL
jgi:hypothetical protein